MAEAGAATLLHRFFCHCCKRETQPTLPDFVCPSCKSDFIEEVAYDSRLLENSPSESSEDSNTLFSELWQLLFMERSALLSHPPSSESELDDSEQLLSGQSRLPLVSPGNAEVRELQLLYQPEEERSPRPEQRPEVEGCVTWIVEQFLADLFTSNRNPGAAPVAFSSMLQLYSNPADYAWGQGGLDTVITELLGQLENTGPPPAEKDMISSLPTVCISKEQKECRLECTVCREEYSSGERVKKLPCLHYFHSECIVPWLELHDTCPVCRKSLEGVDNSLLPQASPSPEGRFISTEHQ
ncbi:E3 ubiquitin-protein ligase RNF115-like isoform X1 [Nerophis lumbriciformis]|uniref:E3 ubiquitin-protein ligase RNF115-like isoform X1 n=1 Tax=Nerophis lumbriciformis TaxID=546530 RepID=UPI002ADF82A2|nr:E3 ubiquitin-protein ligase RNF115-like isoform X1 [Nerophis lumbriciformis]XP_061839389.1 E3 ubiquitin-protein ligase RNF115-like isoform X1 [Nerophis lumbriciformis]